MTPAQSAFVVLALLFGVASWSLSISAISIPRLRRFRLARCQVWCLATVSFLLCAVLAASAVLP